MYAKIALNQKIPMLSPKCSTLLYTEHTCSYTLRIVKNVDLQSKQKVILTINFAMICIIRRGKNEKKRRKRRRSRRDRLGHVIGFGQQ